MVRAIVRASSRVGAILARTVHASRMYRNTVATPILNPAARALYVGLSCR